MSEKITSNIFVKVVTKYVPDISDQYYFFQYHINIQNLGRDTVRLISRHWKISDLIGDLREVKGMGVLDEYPIIEPGASYDYSSGVKLLEPIGYMEGSYTFENLATKKDFQVEVPRFELVASMLFN